MVVIPSGSNTNRVQETCSCLVSNPCGRCVPTMSILEKSASSSLSYVASYSSMPLCVCGVEGGGGGGLRVVSVGSRVVSVGGGRWYKVIPRLPATANNGGTRLPRSEGPAYPG